jgi:hypothetical protein
MLVGGSQLDAIRWQIIRFKSATAENIARQYMEREKLPAPVARERAEYQIEKLILDTLVRLKG